VDNASFDSDEAIAPLGSGASTFGRAKDALRQWAHFDLGWVELHPRGAFITTGTVVAVLIQHLGFWSLNGSRVVYGVGGDNADEFGFAYGTLANHAEMGEEIFKVIHKRDTDEVQYVIRAASRPGAPLARLGRPAVRMLQARFRRDSARAMQRAVTAAAR
jgi:uncharacterized protein (UPF0548 family)